ncbi:MAG: class I SAM-dependent methyltransferase [Clostridia bacterium]|nr:class I SAM-dependent methyltransferase [Clostridia bacterium]
MDNKTAHAAAEYDSKVNVTIPNYEILHSEALELVQTVNKSPETWLDTGCGTGTFVMKAISLFPGTKFVLADPSDSMLEIAGDKVSAVTQKNIEILEPVSSQDIALPEGTFDIVTAIQSHHYMNAETRAEATRNCFRMLKSGGLYITFENIRPFTEKGTGIGLNRWKGFQIMGGKTIEEAQKHVERFGKEFLPITISEHLTVLKNAGFKTVELLYMAYMQAGFYAIKE